MKTNALAQIFIQLISTWHFF